MEHQHHHHDIEANAHDHHDGMDHQHMGHGGYDHTAMIADFRKRFYVVLALTVKSDKAHLIVISTELFFTKTPISAKMILNNLCLISPSPLLK
ncbi:hypothetical protein HH214_08995 [Mucilaginibacter robiniae]|uniref:Uncharacterized protein n=1 Tax=Mucilaginibacter robiniae TaxID=2728022 RepID=A0A7L5DWK3_9SPHI|nr:hypothetical protein [Mucilaginibacter robiniae]QJD94359.1 hypothetical protein HH214_08995 [Mucilaginibacter robiniae]